MNNLSYKKAVNDIKFVYSENNTLSIIFKNNDILMGIVGEFNNNLKELEKITDTTIYSRGNSILVKSTTKKNEMVKNAIVFLVDQFINNGTVEKKDILGPIGIAKISGSSLDRGFSSIIFLMAILSINLGLINLLPIPALDGGYILLFTYELIFKKPLSGKIQLFLLIVPTYLKILIFS